MQALHHRIEQMNPDGISFDPHNPRGLSREQIVRSPEFTKLLDSIKTYGVLMPLIVRPNGDKGFMLIDGERRWHAALDARLTEVPVLVAKDDVDGRVLAYHVHMHFEKWEKPAQTKAIKRIIDDYKAEKADITDTEIKKKLIEEIAIDKSELEDILIICTYEDDVIEKVINEELEVSYLVQIEQSFIRPMRKEHADLIERFGGEDVIKKIMVRKAEEKKLGNTRFLMDKFKVVFKNERKAKKGDIANILNKFLKDEDMKIGEALEEYEALFKSRVKKQSKEEKKDSAGSKQTNLTYSPIPLSQALQTKVNDVRAKYQSIGAELSSAEKEYLKEALCCLEVGCFKAAVTMVWAAGIDRVLSYIGNNWGDFDTSIKYMKNNPVKIYKHYAKSFDVNSNDVDELRLSGNDKQLLAYLFHKKILSTDDFKKLMRVYGERCDCAHPTGMTVSINSAVDIFEVIFDKIFVNQALK